MVGVNKGPVFTYRGVREVLAIRNLATFAKIHYGRRISHTGLVFLVRYYLIIITFVINICKALAEGCFGNARCHDGIVWHTYNVKLHGRRVIITAISTYTRVGPCHFGHLCIFVIAECHIVWLWCVIAYIGCHNITMTFSCIIAQHHNNFQLAHHIKRLVDAYFFAGISAAVYGSALIIIQRDGIVYLFCEWLSGT